ncbi:hypothetical protein BU25DRAFT_487691 [Macroventuria anomochaeta]|uniref:Uncharacterized protein n=1 Tax=Macroventuria anomochaeta TaxID=301207 RepID=A0ACB6SCU8_9PLEO|nr:uncharacterized protein BU25DRAFT_487691 [Macroventuria anomochaeta]KAF2632136.1 hypothetical protein BU25DRAFT_487691 [Macroventuria anomochaeta]
MVPAYASEASPLAMRSVNTSYANLCFVTGQLLGNGVTAATQHMNSYWTYSIPFSLQWFWLLVVLAGMWFAPESLARLSSQKVNVKASVAQIVETDTLERDMEAGSILDFVPTQGAVWAKSAMLLVCNSIYNCSVGLMASAIFCEVSAIRVRSKTIAVATAVQTLVGIIMTVAILCLIRNDEANLGGKLSFFFDGLSVPCLIWWFLRVPEMNGRTYEELNIIFERNVKTRQFKGYQI